MKPCIQAEEQQQPHFGCLVVFVCLVVCFFFLGGGCFLFVCFAFRRAGGLLSLSFPSSASGMRSPRRALFLCTSLGMQNRSPGGKEINFFPLNSACSAEAAVGCHSQDGPKPPPFLPFPPPPPWYRRGYLGMSSKHNSPKSS